MVNTEHILKEIKKSVLATDPGATLILYGSYARGDYNSDSDIDILVLLDKDKITFDDRKRVGYPLYHIELEKDIIISPIIYSRNLWESSLRASPFYKNIKHEGILL